MSETMINDLPTEIIIAILRNVDRKSLKNAALTCKLWKELIESSCPFSLSLNHLNEDGGDDEPWMDFLLATNRKFNKFKFDGLPLGKNCIVDIIQKHGTHISKLFMFNSSLDRLDLFVDVLKFMPNLEHLIFYQITTPCTVADVPTELPEMMRLKTLELVESDANIIKSFKHSKLNEFKVLSYEHQSMTTQGCAVLELLRTQSQMKTLALRSINYDTSTLFQTDIMDGCDKFQLSKLSLLDIKLRESPNDYNNLLKFLKPQAKTIKYLEMGRAFPDLVYEFIFAKFKNLKSLRLMINELPKDMEFYERLDENQSITQLTFIDSPPPNHLLDDGCPPSLKEFIRHVPNVTDLTLLDYCDRGTLEFLSTNLAELKRLSVVYFNESIFRGLRFPNLTSLCIQRIEDDVDWDVFTKCNPDITELIINTGTFAGFSDWTDESRSHLIEKVTQNLRLQTLRIGSHFPTNEHFYEMIRKHATDLKVVDLHRKCALAGHIMNGIPGLCFHDDDLLDNFHNLKYWNEDDYDGNLPDIDRGGNWDDGENLNPFDPFDMHWMEIDDYDEYDQQDDYDDDYDDFVDEYDEQSDFDDR